MLRKAIQLLVLPLLFVLLTAGGNATLCELLSLVAVEAHHHAEHRGDGNDHVGPFCLQDHDDHDHDHGHEHDPVPCPESCGIQLSEASSPALLKVPPVSEAVILPSVFAVAPSARLTVTVFEVAEMLEPPDGAALRTDPIFTGRFLV